MQSDVTAILIDICTHYPVLLTAPALRCSCKRLYTLWATSDAGRPLYYECMIAQRPLRGWPTDIFTWDNMLLAGVTKKNKLAQANTRNYLPITTYTAGSNEDDALYPSLLTTHFPQERPSYRIHNALSVWCCKSTVPYTSYTYALTKVDKFNFIALRLHTTLNNRYNDAAEIIRGTFKCRLEIIDYLYSQPRFATLQDVYVVEPVSIIHSNKVEHINMQLRIPVCTRGAVQSCLPAMYIDCTVLVNFMATSRLNVMEVLSSAGYVR